MVPEEFPSIIGGKYEVIAEIGRGGFGAVYKARNPQLNKTVAIKVLHATLVLDANVRARFEQEARAGAGLGHPNLIPVFDYGFTERAEPFLVMEYVEGVALSEFVTRKKPGTDELVQILVQVGKALRYLHENKIVHRDLKTSNILVQEIGGERYARLLDLGIAKVFAREETGESKHLTSTGMVFGSPMYMSPEQCEGRAIDTRSDIYSFGCVIYECLSGRCPFDGENSLQVIIKHLQQEPERIEYRDGKEAELGRLAERCLEKLPEKRFQSMTELLDGLQRVLDMRVNDRAQARTASVTRSYMAAQAERQAAAPDVVAAGANQNVLKMMGVLLAVLVVVASAVPMVMWAQKQLANTASVITKPEEVAPHVVPNGGSGSAEMVAAQQAADRIRQERLAAERASEQLKESQRKLEEERVRLEAQTRAAQDAAQRAQDAAQQTAQSAQQVQQAQQQQSAAVPAAFPGGPAIPSVEAYRQKAKALGAAMDERYRLTTNALRAFDRATDNMNSGNRALREIEEGKRR